MDKCKRIHCSHYSKCLDKAKDLSTFQCSDCREYREALDDTASFERGRITAGVWETHEKLTGVPPVAVQGKYMPLKFDPRFSGIIEAAEAEKAVKGTGAFKDFFPPSLEKGMTITRKSGGAKRNSGQHQDCANWH